MELAGHRFLDSPHSGSLRFLEPKTLRASSLTAEALDPNHKPPPKKSPEKNVKIAGTLNKLGSHNKFSKLVILDPPYTKVSATLGFRV